MVRVVVVGLGPIGIGAARAVLADPAMELAGLVDIDPAKVGQRIAELEAKINALETKQAQSGKEMAATIDSVLRDAEKRSQYPSCGARYH